MTALTTTILTRRPHSVLIFFSLTVGLVHPISSADSPISFNQHIRVLLSDRCFECHGPDDASRQGDLRLDVPEGPQNPFAKRDGYQILVPGRVNESHLWKRIQSEDDDQRMPPPDSNKPPLSAAEKHLLKKWIAAGAKYEEFWAFRTPEAAPTPELLEHSWANEPLDLFVLARLRDENIAPQGLAGKRALLRRVSLDLNGLPPHTQEIQRFLQDPAPDAYERLVDRRIARPQFGEHMAKYWLDLVRFADTNGIHHDHYREITPYRDWIMRSFNQNLPFDAFIRYQIAGDLYPNPTLDQQIASGFNRLHLIIDRGTALPQESYTRNVVDRVSAFGTAFLGLGLGCAVCHDHKYDPVTQKEFYQLFAFFNNLDMEPETPGSAPHPPVLYLPTAAQRERAADLDSQIAQLQADIATLDKPRPPNPPGSETTPAPSTDELRQRKETELKALESQRNTLQQTMPRTLVSKERQEIRPAFLLNRGNYDQPGEEVARGTPAFLPPLKSNQDIPTRLDLAHWVTNPAQPLTARVTVNRFWQQFYGVGIVKTSEEFGAQGEYPSHPKLLDHLALQFQANHWDVKWLVRRLVTAATYRQSSRASRADFERDRENRLLARGSRFRLDSEMIRDQILSVSGLLNQRSYGKSVKPPQPPNLWKSVSMVSSSTYAFQADQGSAIHRRSIYSFWKRAMPPPQMTIFDAPTRESCVARRERTNTPVQALVLMNESQYFFAAQQLAAQLLGTQAATDHERLKSLYERVTTHLPDPTEIAALGESLVRLRAIYAADPAAAEEITSASEGLSAQERIEHAAYTVIVNSLFNLDITKTRE